MLTQKKFYVTIYWILAVFSIQALTHFFLECWYLSTNPKNRLTLCWKPYRGNLPTQVLSALQKFFWFCFMLSRLKSCYYSWDLHILLLQFCSHIFFFVKKTYWLAYFIFTKNKIKLSPKNFKLQFAHSFRCDGGSKTSILKSRSFGR